jgi:hypothetical protein
MKMTLTNLEVVVNARITIKVKVGDSEDVATKEVVEVKEVEDIPTMEVQTTTMTGINIIIMMGLINIDTKNPNFT